MFGLIIDIIIRLFLLILAVLGFGFMIIAIIWAIGDRNDWW